MFTSSIKSKSFFNGDFKVEVEFTDATQTWTETFLVRSKENLNSSIKQRLTQLNELLTYNVELVTGAYVPTENLAIPQTQEQIDQQKWFRNFNRLEQLTKLNSLGALRPALATELDTLKATVATDFKKAYIAEM